MVFTCDTRLPLCINPFNMALSKKELENRIKQIRKTHTYCQLKNTDFFSVVRLYISQHNIDMDIVNTLLNLRKYSDKKQSVEFELLMKKINADFIQK